MTNDTQILSSKQEFFTIAVTGESGVSIRGLSRMTGIPHPTLVRWFQFSMVHKSIPEPLKPLAGKVLYLDSDVKVRNKLVKPIRSDIASAVIKYAAFSLNKSEAQAAIGSFIDIGLNSFIQGETGYLPEQYQEATKDPRYEIKRLVRDANPWRRLYSKEVCGEARSWYFPRDFFWKFAYSWMTAEEIAFLNEHNPVIEGIWQRQERIFQFLSEETRDRLEPEIQSLCLLVETSTSKQDFETRYKRSIGLNQQEFLNV